MDIEPESIVDLVWQHELDWFATEADLRAAHLGLQKLTETEAGEPVRENLIIHPGVGMSIGDEYGPTWGSKAAPLLANWRAPGMRSGPTVNPSH